MRKLLRSMARSNMSGVKRLNKKLYNPARRKGESDEKYKKRCAKSKPKSLFALNWRQYSITKANPITRDMSEKRKAGLAKFFKGLFDRQYKAVGV